MVTSGIIHQKNCNILANCYSSINPDKTVELIQKLTTTSLKSHKAKPIRSNKETNIKEKTKNSQG